MGEKLKFIWAILVAFLVYGVIPSFLSRGFGVGSFRRSLALDKIAFTFDDGPDPEYTPQLLDLLKKYNIKATFFVLGRKAEQYPELILRMHQEGHLIGVHNYTHRANWLLAPWTIRRELDRSASIIEQITGVQPVYYRPPWGLLNLFDFFWGKRFQIVLWSLMVGDWKSRGGSEKIKRRLLQKVKAGDVILLHDSGDTLGADRDAPLHTIRALEDVFREVQLRGIACVRIDEMIRLERQAIESQVNWKNQSFPHYG